MGLDASEARNHAAATIENEGIGYAVQDYIGGKSYSADVQLARLWCEACIALGELETYLQQNAGEQVDLMDRRTDVVRAKEELLGLPPL